MLSVITRLNGSPLSLQTLTTESIQSCTDFWAALPVGALFHLLLIFDKWREQMIETCLCFNGPVARDHSGCLTLWNVARTKELLRVGVHSMRLTSRIRETWCEKMRLSHTDALSGLSVSTAVKCCFSTSQPSRLSPVQLQAREGCHGNRRLKRFLCPFSVPRFLLVKKIWIKSRYPLVAQLWGEES